VQRRPKTHCLKLFVLESDRKERANRCRLIRSFRGLLHDIVWMKDRDLHNIGEMDCCWWGYMFDSEYIGEELRMALPVFFAHTAYDYYTLYKKMMVRIDGTETMKVYTSPRLFRSHVKVREGASVVPLTEGPTTAILDGWVLEDDWSVEP